MVNITVSLVSYQDIFQQTSCLNLSQDIKLYTNCKNAI